MADELIRGGAEPRIVARLRRSARGGRCRYSILAGEAGRHELIEQRDHILRDSAGRWGQWGGKPPAPDKYFDLSYYYTAYYTALTGPSGPLAIRRCPLLAH